MLRRAGKFSQATVLWGINSGIRAMNLRAPVVASGPLVSLNTATINVGKVIISVR